MVKTHSGFRMIMLHWYASKLIQIDSPRLHRTSQTSHSCHTKPYQNFASKKTSCALSATRSSRSRSGEDERYHTVTRLMPAKLAPRHSPVDMAPHPQYRSSSFNSFLFSAGMSASSSFLGATSLSKSFSDREKVLEVLQALGGSVTKVTKQHTLISIDDNRQLHFNTIMQHQHIGTQSLNINASRTQILTR